MTTENSFSEEVAKQLKWYVYRLIDPRNGETFYVGKGEKNRVFAHAGGEDTLEQDDEAEIIDPKLQRIKDIRAAGLEVGHVIHRHGLSTSKLAYEVEAAVIDAYPGLTNKVRGHGTGDYGSRHVDEIIREYAAEEFEIDQPLLMISIGSHYYKCDTPYDAVRYAWKVNVNRARGKLVLARLRRLVVGAYRPTKWLPATRENFADLIKTYDFIADGDMPGYHGFVTDDAKQEDRDHYVGKRVPARFRLGQNPLRYLRLGD